MNADIRAACQLAMEVVQPQYVALHQVVVIFRVSQRQRQHAEVDQVLPMNARKALDQYDPQTEIARREGRVLTAGALPIVSAGDNRVSANLASGQGALVIGFVNALKQEFGDPGNVAAERKDSGAGWQNLIRRNVIPNLQHNRDLQRCWEWVKTRQRLNVRPHHEFLGAGMFV